MGFAHPSPAPSGRALAALGFLRDDAVGFLAIEKSPVPADQTFPALPGPRPRLIVVNRYGWV